MSNFKNTALNWKRASEMHREILWRDKWEVEGVRRSEQEN